MSRITIAPKTKSSSSVLGVITAFISAWITAYRDWYKSLYHFMFAKKARKTTSLRGACDEAIQGRTTVNIIPYGARAGGFTLIELLVATALFTVVVTTAIGSMITTVDAYRRARATQVAVDNLNFALESMSRAIRQGKSYSSSEATRFSFVDAVSAAVTYRLQEDAAGKGVIEQSRDGGVTFLPLTAQEIDIDALVFGIGVVGGGQERVRIFVRGSVGAGQNAEEFALQTLITQRN